MSNNSDTKDNSKNSTNSGSSYGYGQFLPVNSNSSSFDSKRNDSGVGNSQGQTNSEDSSNQREFIVRKVELVSELKNLLNVRNFNMNRNLMSGTTSSSQFSSNTDDTNMIVGHSDFNRTENKPYRKQDDSTSRQSQAQETEIDSLMYQAIQYIKVLEKNQLQKYNIGSSINSSVSGSGSGWGSSYDNFLPNLNQKIVAKNATEEMSITILAKTSLVVYLDKTLINILGNRAWIGRRLTDHLYDYDCVLLQSKLNKIAEKISAGFKKIHEIEPFYLRILKLNDSTQDTKKNKKSSSAITFKGKDMREFLIFKVDIKPDTVELKTVEDSEKTSSSSNVPGSCQNLNMETCFILKLSFPTNSYLQEISSAERMFITEHNTNLKITRVENRVCELLGFLPQDLENRSLLKFIHPEDLEKIKNIHFEIYNNSQQEEFDDYRWRCFNGSFVSVRSKWSCLKHPWNKHIDLIIGKHFIVDEPSNKFIFDEPCKEDRNTIYRVDQDNNKTKVTFKENLKIVEKEIIELISRKIPSMEEETQILGQSMIKLINNKNISKHFYNEQMKKLRKHQKQKSWRIKQNETLKMFKRKNRMLSPEEPFYYTLNSKLNESRRERLARLNSRSSHQVGKVVKKQTDKSLGSFGTKNKFSGKKDEKENSIECDAGNINNEENIKFEDAQFDASLFTDKGFFTHYTICKYIDDLPDEWSVENDELDELNATCNKIGVSVDSGSSGSANSSLNQKDSYKRTLSSQPINVPNKLNENSVTEQNMSNSDSSKTDSSQKKSKKFKPNDFTKNYIEFLLKKKDDKENITLKKSKNKTNTNEVDDLKKGLSTISSKSHSKIVLFNDQEYEEDAEEEDEEEFDEFENIQPPMKSSNLETSKNEDHDSAKNLSGQTETINNKSENLNNLNANLKSTSNDSGSNSNSNNDKKNTSSNEVLSTNSTLNSSLNKDSKFTQEALAKHTIEQDELYTQDILRKIRCPIKYYSEKPQNICAQAPNVFSRNKYEMPLKSKPTQEKNKVYEKTAETTKKQKKGDDEEDEEEILSSEEEYDTLGPYAITSNQINCDNPQEYHEIFHKKLKHSTPFKENEKEKEGSKEVSSSQQSSSTSVKNSRTDDLIKYWKRFTKHESIIAKRLKESEKLLKKIFLYLCEIKNFEENLKNSNSSDSKSEAKEIDEKVEEILKKNTEEEVERKEQDKKETNKIFKAKIDHNFNYSKCSNQIKKSLYSVALLLGVNIDLISESISSNSSNNKSELLDNHIKKIHEELVGMKLNQNSSLVPLYISKQIDPNSIALLNFMYENLKNKFNNQFNHFKLQKKRILNSSLMGMPNWSSSAFNIREYLSQPFSDNDMHSSNNTTSLNDYDDSSTYLFDSPTISFESNEDKNKKKSKVNEISESKHKKSETISSGSNNSNIISIKRLINCGKTSNSLENLVVDPDKPTTSRRLKSLSPTKVESNFDDSLCVKIMQNYIDLFGKKDHLSNNEEDNDQK